MKNDSDNGCLGCFFVVLAVIFILAIIIISPLLTIWSLNTLFPVLAISYTWKTWLSVLLLSGFISAFVSGFFKGFFQAVAESFKN